MSPDVKPYEAEGFYFEFSPNGSPYVGTLRTTDEGERGPYEAELSLTKAVSRERYARKAAELYEMDSNRLERALNEVCTRRSEEVAAAEKAAEDEADESHEASDISPERRAEAMRLLESPDLLEKATVDMERLGHVGEVATKKLAMICALSARSGRPIQPSTHAQSSAGKNALCDAVLALLPEEMIVRRSGLTAKALFRTETDLKGAVLYLQEVAGSEDANYSIRAMQSDGRLEYEATEKTPDGSMKNIVYRTEGPTVIVQTTTKNHLHPENETRVFPIYIDESEEQTGRIVENILMDAAGHGVGTAERERVRQRWHDAVRLLEPELGVVLPYAERIEIPTSPIRIRRDTRRLVDVVRVIGWLHQHRRGRDEANRIVATEEDFHLALKLVSESLTRAWRTLTPAEEAVLFVIDKLPDNSKSRGFRRRDLKVKGISDRRVKDVLKSLTETGYLDCDGRAGPQGFSYTVAREAEELDKLRLHRSRLEDLERDKETLLNEYARMVPEALDELTGEERHQVYRMLRLQVFVYPDGDLDVRGVLREAVCTKADTGLRILQSANNFGLLFRARSPEGITMHENVPQWRENGTIDPSSRAGGITCWCGANMCKVNRPTFDYGSTTPSWRRVAQFQRIADKSEPGMREGIRYQATDYRASLC